MKTEYFLGLDIGTDSIGWAVTDKQYNLLKFNGKSMWGIHLFEAGKTAEDRRMFRSARRRRQRAIQRRNLLREFFDTEIQKVDPEFFRRLDESFFWADDKTLNQKNSLFNDYNYNDSDYHTQFPTIYHLRKALIESDEKFDIRLIYLAVEHILKHRGHFLYGESDMESSVDFLPLYKEWCNECFDVLGEDIALTDPMELKEILKESAGVTQKKQELKVLYGTKLKGLIELLSGGKIKITSIFGDEYADCEIKSVTFKGDSFDVSKDALASEIGEDNIHLLEKTKALFDWGVLSEILKDEKFLSYAKVNTYNKHEKDLKLLKTVIKNCTPDQYNAVFKAGDIKGNYASYIGMTKKGGKKQEISRCTQEEFYKYIKKILDQYKGNDIVDSILFEIESATFLPKQVTKDNSVIPYQLHLAELREILKNASKHYQFLNESDKYGTVSEKIESILTFKIPYYVGPLNAYHGKNSWLEKYNNESIRPWNFSEVVNTEKSAEKFIERMTNYCTYIPSEPVLAKNSVLYCKYMVFNELNNLKINGIKISLEQKHSIYNDLFLAKVQPKIKDIKKHLKNKYGETEVEISGLAEDIKSSMKSYIDFKNIIGDKVSNEKMVDEIIRLITILGDEKEMLINRIKELYREILTEDEIKKISKLRYSGWGNFSRKLLTEIRSMSDNSNIIELLETTNENFMQIIYNDAYGINKQLDEIKAQTYTSKGITYESLDDLYVSPSNKKRIWRVMVVVKEIVKVMGCEPTKIFIEMARGTDDKNNKLSRKKQLLELYVNEKENKDIIKLLGDETESRLRNKKLYLYYRQMGKCMYSGDPLNPSDFERYEIDHIIPRSKKDDDSLDNTVLVKKELNQQKKNIYPIPNEIISDKARDLWRVLLAKGFITKEKYARLTRKTELTIDELADFVNRQLVETRQTTKIVADIFKRVYQNAEIVYVKAKNVSDFRHGGYLTKTEKKSGDYSGEAIVKVREINDFHHAKDAYLNIVVGNIYNERFNHDVRSYILGGNKYHLANLCSDDVERAGWCSGYNGTIKKIKTVLSKNNILYTVMPYEQRGGFFNQMLLKKGKGQFPIKTSDARYANIDRYGGYDNVSGSYFTIVRSIIKGKSETTIEAVPLYLKNKVEGNKEELILYFESKGMENIEILVPKLKCGTLIKFNNTFVHITGRTGNHLVLCNRVQLCVSEAQERYIKKIVKYNESILKDSANAIDDGHNGITPDKNIGLYDYFIKKLETPVYKELLSTQIKNLEESREQFVSLSLGEQNKVLYQILHLFQCNRIASDLSLIGKAKSAGNLCLNKKLKETDKMVIINQSPTGLFETHIDISKL